MSEKVEAWFNQGDPLYIFPTFERAPFDQRDPYVIDRALKERYEAAHAEWEAVQEELAKAFGF